MEPQDLIALGIIDQAANPNARKTFMGRELFETEEAETMLPNGRRAPPPETEGDNGEGLPSNSVTVVSQEAKVLERFSLKRETIKDLSDKFSGLTIAGLTDKKGYEVVHAALRDVRTHRLSIDKDHKALKDRAWTFGKLCDKAKNLLLAEISPLEDYLEGEKKRIDAEDANQKAEKQRVISELCAKRQADLIAVDAVQAIHPLELAGMSEVDFQAHLSVATTKFNAKKEAEAVQAAELERLRTMEAEAKAEQARAMEAKRKEQEAEQKRLAGIAAEQAKAQAAIKAAQDKLAADQRAHEAQVQREADEKKRLAELEKAKAEAAEKAKAEAEAKAQREADAKAEAERKAKVEAERLAALAPEREKVSRYFDALGATIPPDVKDKRLKQLISDIGLAIAKANSEV